MEIGLKDLFINYMALWIAIERGVIPEVAFHMAELSLQYPYEIKRSHYQMSDEDYEDVVGLKEDMLQYEIAEMFGISAHTLSKRLTRYNLKKRRDKGEKAYCC